jgi:hypothetical protein
LFDFWKPELVTAPATVATAATAAAPAPSPTAAGTSAAATTTEATASTAAAAKAASTTAARSTLGFGSGFVDGEVAAIKVATVQLLHCGFGFAVIRHFDERKAARLSGIAVAHDVDGIHGAELGECLAQRVFVCLEIQVAHVNILHWYLAKG